MQIAFVFILSHVFKKTKTAAVTGNLWLMLSGYLCGTLFTPLIAKDRWYMVRILFSLFSSLFLFGRASFICVCVRAR